MIPEQLERLRKVADQNDFRCQECGLDTDDLAALLAAYDAHAPLVGAADRVLWKFGDEYEGRFTELRDALAAVEALQPEGSGE